MKKMKKVAKRMMMMKNRKSKKKFQIRIAVEMVKKVRNSLNMTMKRMGETKVTKLPLQGTEMIARRIRRIMIVNIVTATVIKVTRRHEQHAGRKECYRLKMMKSG